MAFQCCSPRLDPPRAQNARATILTQPTRRAPCNVLDGRRVRVETNPETEHADGTMGEQAFRAYRTTDTATLPWTNSASAPRTVVPPIMATRGTALLCHSPPTPHPHGWFFAQRDFPHGICLWGWIKPRPLYTSDAADELTRGVARRPTYLQTP